MHSELSMVSLDALGVLRARGPDVLTFLQGQLSNDLTKLTAARSLLAGYHNPQGRVIALLRVLQLAPDDLLAVLPRELIVPVIARLSKFVLRAKVKLADDSPQWRITGVMPAVPGTSASVDAELRADATEAGALAVRVAQEPARWLLVAPAAQAPLAGGRATASEGWWRLAIACGEPQVYAATSEEFVGQMLNLDCVGAIDFEKGCYTGQEVIARAHYRGRVKRRMQRFITQAPQLLKPGESGVFTDGRGFKVVESMQLADGRCEFLAVAPLPVRDAEPDAADAAAGGTASQPQLSAAALPLPYDLPG
jgi:folate-binding protein YgfZ